MLVHVPAGATAVVPHALGHSCLQVLVVLVLLVLAHLDGADVVLVDGGDRVDQVVDLRLDHEDHR